MLTAPPIRHYTALDMAQGFWALLIPHGLKGGALAHVSASAQQDGDGDGDVVMGSAGEEGWKDEYTQWWFEFLESSGAKGVSKDVWHMVSCRFWPLDGRRWDCLWESASVDGLALISFVPAPVQFLEFVRTIDAKFEKYDPEGASPPLPWHTSFFVRGAHEKTSTSSSHRR
ncbi:hypothetical protein C8Q70DRAFT_119323 [Cubamyces menziesii]|nr:hypothetical protein C8Q70DRAFT_119323 [Cubamyces menziesii]